MKAFAPSDETLVVLPWNRDSVAVESLLLAPAEAHSTPGVPTHTYPYLPKVDREVGGGRPGVVGREVRVHPRVVVDGESRRQELLTGTSLP